MKGIREENLVKQVSKLEAEKDTLQKKLKEPEKVKEQWNGKIQKLHDKNRELKK